MDYIRVIALLAHPILASADILDVAAILLAQEGVNLSKVMKEKSALEQHEKFGEYILWSGFAVVGVAFLCRMIAGWRSEQDIFAEIWPTNLHGFIGPLGLILLYAMTRFGKQAKANRLAGESFAVEKTKHGRAADFQWRWCLFTHSSAFCTFSQSFSLLSIPYHGAATYRSIRPDYALRLALNSTAIHSCVRHHLDQSESPSVTNHICFDHAQ